MKLLWRYDVNNRHNGLATKRFLVKFEPIWLFNILAANLIAFCILVLWE